MKSDVHISEYFIKNHPIEAVRVLENLNSVELTAFLNEIPDIIAIIIFKHLERYSAIKCLEKLTPDKSANIIEHIPIDIAAIFLRRIKQEISDAILDCVSKEYSSLLKRILNYSINSAGALADPLVLTLPEDLTVKEAMKRVQKRPEQAIYYLYILNREQALAGVISITELMLATQSALLSSIMQKDVIRLSAEANFNAITNHPGWQKFHALPVVEENNIFSGAIRYETLRRLEKQNQKSRMPRHALEASNALSELYKIGLSGLLRSAATPLKNNQQDK